VTDIALIRKLAAQELGKRALAELTAEPDDSLDRVLLYKAAQAEDSTLFKIAMDLSSDPLCTYEALGGKFKQAFGQPMFGPASAPDPKVQASGLRPSSSSSSGPKSPSGTVGPQGGGGDSTGVSTPGISNGPVSPGAGTGIG
jgi:hypothetical protein